MSSASIKNPIVFAAYCPGKIYSVSSSDTSVGVDVFGFTLSLDDDGRLDARHIIHFLKPDDINRDFELLKKSLARDPHNVELRERVRVMQHVQTMFGDLHEGKASLADLETRIGDELESFRRMYYIPEQPIAHINTVIFDEAPMP